jgi:glycosyltransferase involved in cell wall biosynthesis
MTIRPTQGNPIKLYTTHEHWLVCPMHVLWKFNRQACDKPECLRCTFLGKRPPQLWRYNGMLVRTSQHVDRFVSPSRFTAQMHAQRGFSQPVGHLPYFIQPVDQDWQNPGPRPQENPYFLMVGRLEIIKGFQTVIDIWDQIKGYDLVIAGTGNYSEQLRSLAASNPHIKFLGSLPQKELGKYYYHAIATIVPSITYETFGIIIVESLARKTPVIVRDLGALPEVVHDSEGGIVYQANEELLAAVNRLGSSPELRTELGEKGYQVFIQTWSKEAHLRLYFDLLNSIAREKYNRVPWED